MIGRGKEKGGRKKEGKNRVKEGESEGGYGRGWIQNALH
jgi:hypothetical protein